MITEAQLEQARLAKCNICPHNHMCVCLKCGCLIMLKVKLANTSCPIGRW